MERGFTRAIFIPTGSWLRGKWYFSMIDLCAAKLPTISEVIDYEDSRSGCGYDDRSRTVRIPRAYNFLACDRWRLRRGIALIVPSLFLDFILPTRSAPTFG